MSKWKKTTDALINPLLVTIAVLLAIDHWQHFGVGDLLLLTVVLGLGFRIGRS